MRYVLIILFLFPSIASSACIQNDYSETINYWYYHNDGTRKCIKKLRIKPSKSICNSEYNREFHFIKKNNSEAEWLYYHYEDKIHDKLIFKNDIMIVNNKVIEGKKTTKNLTKSKAIEYCNEPPITINENKCITGNVGFPQKKQIILSVINYIFSEYDIKYLFYQEITMDSKVVDLITDLHHLKIKQRQRSVSYRFKKFRKCGDYLVVNLISYSAPKASSERVFILKIIDNTLEVIKEDMLWIS